MKLDMSNFVSDSFRVETLPDYPVDNAPSAALSLFLKTGEIPPGWNADWQQIIRAAIERGGQVRRLRLISEPPSRYEAYEIVAGYSPGISAGEEIRIAPRAESQLRDFRVYDGSWVEWLNYDSNGNYVQSTFEPISDELRSELPKWEAVWANAEPVADAAQKLRR